MGFGTARESINVSVGTDAEEVKQSQNPGDMASLHLLQRMNICCPLSTKDHVCSALRVMQRG